MLQAQHTENSYTITFSAAEEIGEVISNAYKVVNNWVLGKQSENTSAGFSADELLEILDRTRIPLAEKKFDDIELSVIEEGHLMALEHLTDKILTSSVSIPEEPVEVKMALQYARRIAQQR